MELYGELNNSDIGSSKCWFDLLNSILYLMLVSSQMALFKMHLHFNCDLHDFQSDFINDLSMSINQMSQVFHMVHYP